MHIATKKQKSYQFSEIEEKLLALGVLKYCKNSNNLNNSSLSKIISSNISNNKSNIMINDWSAIKNRFLPHRTVYSIQSKLTRVKKMNEQLRKKSKMYDIDAVSVNNNDNNDNDNDNEIFSKKKYEWTDEEKSSLIIGIQKYGTSAWTRISKELLPNWSPKLLRE